jgi:hypothetical protein
LIQAMLAIALFVSPITRNRRKLSPLKWLINNVAFTTDK